MEIIKTAIISYIVAMFAMAGIVLLINGQVPIELIGTGVINPPVS